MENNMKCDKCNIEFEKAKFKSVDNLEYHNTYFEDYEELLCEDCCDNAREEIWYQALHNQF